MCKYGTYTVVETAANKATAGLSTANYNEEVKEEMGDTVPHLAAHVAPEIRNIWKCGPERGHGGGAEDTMQVYLG